MPKNKSATIPESGSVVFIPLCQLKKSPRNARKTRHTKAEIETLAASIKAHGIIQNPVVEPEFKGKKATGYYLVTAGEGRRLAQLLRVKRNEIKKNEPIRCAVDTTHNAFEISFAENAIRSEMHPADQFEAFFKLQSEEGMNDEDIAARFGVTSAVVRQRLKLAAVSPKLIQAYRDREMNLDQLTAFAITDDHAKQEQVWASLPNYRSGREGILAALTQAHIAADDRRVLFVGAEAYQAAGGAIIRDLFAEDGAGYFVDAALVNRLAEEKLQALAEGLRAEGWKWIEVMPEFDHGFTASMRRIYPQYPELGDEDQAKLDELEAEYEALDGEGEDDVAEIERIEAAVEALRGSEQYPPEQVVRAGAIVTLSVNGTPRIERGYVRPEDDAKEPREKKACAIGGKAPLSDKLTAELTAHRTMALRRVLGARSDVALIAVVHALAAQTFFPHSERLSCLDINAKSAFLGSHAAGIEERADGEAIAARHTALAASLPDDPVALWDAIAAMDEAPRLALLSHCVALTLSCVQLPHARENAALDNAGQIAGAVSLDMAAHWQPTAATYFARVSKDRILEAVRESVSKEAADNLASMKKGAMAEAAETRVAGRGWLPPVLRTDAQRAAA